MALDTKSRILVYNDKFFLTSQTFIYSQVQCLAEKYEVDLLASHYENPHGFETESFRKYEISLPVNIIGKAISKMYRIVNDTLLNLTLMSYIRLNKIFKENNYAAIHAHFGYNGLNILRHAKKHKIPLVVTFHGYDASSMLANENYRKRLPELFDYASSIILVSNHMIENLNAQKWINKIKIIPCTVNPDDFKPSTKQPSGPLKILHSGRLVDKKGVTDLIKVFKNLHESYHNIELHIVGDGKKLDKCKGLVEKLELGKNVKFYGAVSHDEVKEIMTTKDIFVLNSRVGEDGDMEGTPVTLLEAMCAKVPVVSTYHAGIPDVIENGVNGLLVEERDNEGLEKALQKYIENPQLREEYAENARSTVMKEYTVHQMKDKLDQVFQTI